VIKVRRWGEPDISQEYLESMTRAAQISWPTVVQRWSTVG